MKRNLLVVRHGERIDDVDQDWLKTAKFPSDPPLTQRGRAQASAAGKLIASQGKWPAPPIAVISSPFRRCIETASAIVQACTGPPPPLFIEPGISEWIIEKHFPRRQFSLDTDFIPPVTPATGYRSAVPYAVPPWGESAAALMARFRASLDAMDPLWLGAERAGMASATVVALTHGYGVQCFCELGGATAEQVVESGVCYASVSHLLSEDGKGSPWECQFPLSMKALE